MEIQTVSRFITYPDTVEKSNNHTVVLIDPTVEEIENIGFFCKVSEVNFDIYLYNGSTGDLEWLNYITDLSDQVLINDTSEVTITGAGAIRYGEQQTMKSVLEYFQKQDNSVVNIIS